MYIFYMYIYIHIYIYTQRETETERESERERQHARDRTPRCHPPWLLAVSRRWESSQRERALPATQSEYISPHVGCPWNQRRDGHSPRQHGRQNRPGPHQKRDGGKFVPDFAPDKNDVAPEPMISRPSTQRATKQFWTDSCPINSNVLCTLNHLCRLGGGVDSFFAKKKTTPSPSGLHRDSQSKSD